MMPLWIVPPAFHLRHIDWNQIIQGDQRAAALPEGTPKTSQNREVCLDSSGLGRGRAGISTPL